MAKTTAPLLSFNASGQIAKTQVYGSWRGIPYGRRYVVPSNPNTASQQQTRGVFSFLNGMWKVVNPNVQNPWTLFSKGRPFFNRNAWISRNLPGLRGTTGSPSMDLSTMIVSPGANGGLAAAGIATASGGAGALTITLTAPDLPDGWSITNAHFLAKKQVEAETSTDYTSEYQSDNSDPYTGVYAGLATGTYACFGFFEFMKPDGSTAYSPSLYHQQAVA
jgi:hypothetical protein